MNMVVYGYPETILRGIVTSNTVGDGIYAKTETSIHIVKNAESDALFSDVIHGSKFKFIIGDEDHAINASFSDVIGNLYIFTGV